MNNLEFEATVDHSALTEDNRARGIPTLDDWTGAIQALHRQDASRREGLALAHARRQAAAPPVSLGQRSRPDAAVVPGNRPVFHSAARINARPATFSYGEAAAQVHAATESLRALARCRHCGADPGDHVAIVCDDGYSRKTELRCADGQRCEV